MVASLCGQRGFTITELLLVLGVGAVINGASFAVYSVVSESNVDRANALATTNLAISIKDKWRGMGSYNGLDAESVYNAGLVVKPYSYTPPGPLLNSYGLGTDVSGAGYEFTIQTLVPRSKCVETVESLGRVAYTISWSGGVIKNAATPLSSWDGNCGPDDPVLLTAFVK